MASQSVAHSCARNSAGKFDDGAHFRLNVISEDDLTTLAQGQGICNICALHVGLKNDLDLVGTYFVYQ